MQLSLDFAAEATPGLVGVRQRLLNAFGPFREDRRLGPMDQLVRSMICGRTQDAASDAAFARLRLRFRPWRELLNASLEEVTGLLGIVTFGPEKATRLFAAFARIRERTGDVGLEALTALSVEEAYLWLRGLEGVGAFAAAATLNFSILRRRILAIDTHCLRVLQRLGLVPADDLCGGGWQCSSQGCSRRLDRRGCLRTTLAFETARAGPLRPRGTPVRRAAPFRRSARKGSSREEGSEPKASSPGPPHGPAAGPFPARWRFETEATPFRWSLAAAMSVDTNLARLRSRIERLEAAGTVRTVESDLSQAFGLSLGFAPIDTLLPKGVAGSGVHQIAPASRSDPMGATGFAAALLARGLARPGARALIVREKSAIRETGAVYAPGLKAMGVDPARLVFAETANGPGALRLGDEALRAAAVDILVVELFDGAPLAELRITRRFNLAARPAGMLVLLLTPDLSATSAAVTRWVVSSASSKGRKRRLGRPAFGIGLARNRLGPTGNWTLEWDADERAFAPTAPMAAPVVLPAVHRPHAA